jgi:hypothetical protein
VQINYRASVLSSLSGFLEECNFVERYNFKTSDLSATIPNKKAQMKITLCF